VHLSFQWRLTQGFTLFFFFNFQSAMSLPANVVYFVGYDWLKGRLAPHFENHKQYPPLLAGAFARSTLLQFVISIDLVEQ
jgi:hypothetical protein